MRYKIIILLTSLLLSTTLIGEEKKDNVSICGAPDTLTPMSATLFLKVPKISKAIDFLNTKKEFFNLGNSLFKYDKWIKKLKDKANIDILNLKSLKEAGIDINNALYLASIENEKKSPEAVFFIPITDKKNFPLNFVKLLNKISDKKDNPDLNPAISPYKGLKVFQISNDIFFSVIDGYFVLTSSGNLLKQIIDFKINGCGSSLSMDSVFIDYKQKSETNEASNIFTVYIKKDFIDKSYETIQESGAPKEGAKLNTDQNEKANNITDEKNTPPKDGKAIIPKNTNLDFIKYISFSFDAGADEISLTGALSVNKEDQLGDLLMRAVTTGMFDKALFAENPSGYHFISIDINSIYKYLDDLSKKDANKKKAYSKWMASPEGKNILEDVVLPCAKSFINIVIKKPKNIGEMDNFVIFIPMEECGKIEGTLKKIKNELKNKYKEDGAFGEEKINGINSFWFKNDPKNKINILEYKGNFYAGNNIDTLKTALNSLDKKSLDIQKGFVKKADKNTFLLSYTEFNDESFLKAILMMIAYNKNPGLYGFINKIESISLIGNKANNDFILNYSIKMAPEKK